MKKIFFILVIAATISFTGCKNNGSNNRISTNVIENPKSANGSDEKPMPKMVFEETTHDFGKIIRGEKLKYKFRFKNTGNADLVISKVSTSCGCTASHYSKEPIKPGQESYIEVVFDSTHKRGKQNKTVTIITNTNPNRTVLRIKGNVVMPEENY